MPKIKLNKIEKQELLKIKQKSQLETIRDRAHAVLLRHQGFYHILVFGKDLRRI